LILLFDLVKTKRIRIKIPIGKVKYKKFKGRRSKFLNPTSPTACFLAKSKRDVIPIIPNFLNEYKKLRQVGIEPINIPVQNKNLIVFSFLNK
tara:strand:- start:354 stop:629 length:276 start_codon:yes stop_codon:yes gene_type:complete